MEKLTMFQISLKTKKASHNSGFTLLETMLYIGIFVVLLGGLIYLFTSISQTQIKSQIVSEVEEQGYFLLSEISQKIQNSNGINNPNPGQASGSLGLSYASSNFDPVNFAINNDILQISEGGNPALDLHNDKIEISNLEFTNLSLPDTPGNLQIEFQLDYRNPQRSKYQYSQTFSTAISLKQ